MKARAVSASRALRSFQRGAVVVAIWFLAGLYWGSERSIRLNLLPDRVPLPFWDAAWPFMFLMAIWAVYSPLILFVFRRLIPESARLSPVQITLLITFCLFFPVAPISTDVLLLAHVVKFPDYFGHAGQALVESLRFWYHFHLFTLLVFLTIFWGGRIAGRTRERERRAARLVSQLCEAQLEALRLQIQPHFLFNALNTLLPLIYRSPETATSLILSLGELLRLSLKSDPSQFVPLSAELEFLEKYLCIERVRFQDRLRIELVSERDLFDTTVPNLLLPPLVECAIRKGVAANPGTCDLLLSVSKVEGRLTIEIRVRCEGPSSAPTLPDMSDPVLERMRKRLDLLYPEGYHFLLAPEESGWRFNLGLPVHLASFLAASPTALALVPVPQTWPAASPPAKPERSQAVLR